MDSLAKALAQYSSDYDGDMPTGSSANQVTRIKSMTGACWASQIYPYVHQVQDFDDGLETTAPDHNLGSVVSFAYNRNAARSPTIHDWTSPARTVLLYQVTGAHAMIDVPGELNCIPAAHLSPAGDGTYLILIDGQWPRSVEPGTGPIGGRSTLTAGCDWPDPLVDGGSFFLMGDGHVSWIRPLDVSSGFNATSPDGDQNGIATGLAAGALNAAYKATFSTR